MPRLLEWLIQNEPSFSKSRLPSLYSDLSQQQATNPDGFAANVTTWQSALIHAALAGQLPTEQKLTLQSSDELLNALSSSQYGRPSGLGIVLDDCVRSGKMLDLTDFQKSEQSIYHRSWIPSPWVVLRWSLRQAGILGNGSYDVSGRLRSGQLVLVTALEQVSKQVLAAQNERGQSITDRIMTREEFATRLAKDSDTKLTERDIDVLLKFLSRDKQAIAYNANTVKFKAPTAVTPGPITTEDSTIASMKTLMSNLERQISTLEERISKLQESAQTAVKNKNKQSALSALRSKRLAERTLQQRNATLDQLEELYTKIEQAVDQVQIVELMQASTGVLKSLNQRVGGIERVEDVMEKFKEEMGKVDEVEQVVQEPLDGRMVLDETEVDDELEAMEMEERKLKEAQEVEATRRRLQELDAAEAEKRRAQAVQAQKSMDQNVTTEQQVQQDAEMLDRVHISNTSGDDGRTSTNHQRIAEPAS